MTMVELDSEAHVLLKHVKKNLTKRNPLYKITHSTVIKHALTKLKKSEDYEIKLD